LFLVAYIDLLDEEVSAVVVDNRGEIMGVLVSGSVEFL
jgi:hypothetical protein